VDFNFDREMAVNRLWLRAEIKTIALGVAVIGLFAFAHWGFAPKQMTNAGFGPGWDCTPPMQGGSVCIKKVGPKQ
jgi:hypothetical protein